MYECFHCGCKSVIWDSDFDFSDFDGAYDGEGIVHYCHCTNCGRRITYEIYFDDEEEEDVD